MPDDRAQDAPLADSPQPIWQNPAGLADDQQQPIAPPTPSFSPTPVYQPELRIPQSEPEQFQPEPNVPAVPIPEEQSEFSPSSQYEPPVEQQYEEQPQQYAPPEEPQQDQQYQQDPNAQAYAPAYAQMPVQPEPEYLLLEWMADSRVTWRRSKEYYSSLAVIVLLISLILFFAGQTLLIFVVLAFLFISYVLSTVRAESIPHQFTTYGLRYRGEKLIYWSEMVRFWVKNNHGIIEIHIEAPGELMNELILLPANAQSPSPITADDIVDLLSRYLPFEEPLPSQLDRWVTWIQEKFPLE